MSDIKAPGTDELIDRHHFYANLSNEIKNNTKDINGVGTKLADFSEKFETVRDNVKTTTIRNKTLIKVAIVVWTLLGSGITAYVKHGLDTFDKSRNQIEVLEKKITALEGILESHKNIPVKLEALTRKYDEAQRKLDDIEYEKNKGSDRK